MRLLKSCVLPVCLAMPAVAFASQVSFSNHTQNSASGFSSGVPLYTHADLNNDGREDLVFGYHPEMGAQDSFGVQLSTGDGTYATPVSYELPSSAGGVGPVLIGDFNNDGHPDILAFGTDDNTLYLYVNNGKGAFTIGGTFTYGSGTQSSGVTAATGDFNHDSLTDLAFVNAGQLHVWFGNGKGGFTPGPAMGVNGANPVLGDFDGDGKADLLLTDTVNYTVAYVLYGDGTGHFPHTTTITFSNPAGTTGTHYVAFSAGEINGDGKTDILATEPTVYTNRVFFYYGDASRTFASRTNVQVGRCLAGPAQVADLDGNGINDLIVQERDCSDTYDGPFYVDVRTRNPNATYNQDRTIYSAQPVAGVKYGVPFPPEVIRGNLDTRADLLVSQCADDRCLGYLTTTQLNTTPGPVFTCNAPAAARGINVCSPSATTPVASPVSFSIGAAGESPMRDVEVWVDGKKLAERIDGFSYYTFLNTSLALNPGSHHVDVYGAGVDQSLVKKSFTVSVQ